MVTHLIHPTSRRYWHGASRKRTLACSLSASLAAGGILQAGGASQMKWYTDNESVLELARWLADQCEFDDIDDVIYFFSKPWKYEAEWLEYQACHCGKHERVQVEGQ